MTPCRGYFLASFALGEKAVSVILESKFPNWVIKTVESAPRYAEGRGVRFEVTKVGEVTHIARHAQIKSQN